jgi:hypothetical protein
MTASHGKSKLASLKSDLCRDQLLTSALLFS